jgi:hypothetical protein
MSAEVFVWRGEYFVTRLITSVDLVYSLRKRKFVTPSGLGGGRIEYRLLPGRYVLFSSSTAYRSQTFEVVHSLWITLADVRGSRDGINLEKENLATRVVDINDVKTVLSSPVPQQVKDFVKMALRRPLDRRIFKKVYSDEEHQKLLDFLFKKVSP